MMDQRSISGAIRTVTDTSDNERKALALEALSKLAAQFAHDPDLQKLLDSLVLTIAGQFGVASTYIAIRPHNSESALPIIAATGKFRNLPRDGALFHLVLSFSNMTADPGPLLLNEHHFPLEEESGALAEMHRLDIRLVAPMVDDNKIIGIILLGPRLRNIDFGEPDVELLEALITTVTPLIANSLLYTKMSQLKTRYLRIMDSIPQAMFVFDADGTLRTINRTASDLIVSLGGAINDDTLIGRSMETVFPESIFPEWIERLQSARSEIGDKLHSTVIVKRDNQDKIFSIHVSSLAEQSGTESEKIFTLQDITNQKNNEQRMFELEKFAEQGMLASSISHELNNFLAMILGGTEMAIVNVDRGRTEKVAVTLGKIKESVEAMRRFTAGLMDFTRVNVQKQPENINNVVTDVLSFVLAQKRFGRINVKTYLAPQLPAVEMDRDQIAQVIINILNNAADAIAETGRSDGVIVVTTKNSNSLIGLSISDNGKGMKPEVRDKLFKTHLTTKPKGHGYGLMNCGKIIERHGGIVEINSQIGFGTTFNLLFPTVPTPEK